MKRVRHKDHRINSHDCSTKFLTLMEISKCKDPYNYLSEMGFKLVKKSQLKHINTNRVKRLVTYQTVRVRDKHNTYELVFVGKSLAGKKIKVRTPEFTKLTNEIMETGSRLWSKEAYKFDNKEFKSLSFSDMQFDFDKPRKDCIPVYHKKNKRSRNCEVGKKNDHGKLTRSINLAKNWGYDLVEISSNNESKQDPKSLFYKVIEKNGKFRIRINGNDKNGESLTITTKEYDKFTDTYLAGAIRKWNASIKKKLVQ